MNKKYKLFIVVTLGIAILFCGQPESYADTSFKKFTRGLTNIATAPFELIRQPIVLHDEYDYNVVGAFFGGIFKGVYAVVVRELSGVYEFVTFPFPVPAEYRSVIDPPTVFEDYQTPPRDYKS